MIGIGIVVELPLEQKLICRGSIAFVMKEE